MLISACATAPTSGPAALVGTWTNTLGAVWTVNPDGTFQVDLDKEGKPDVWGHHAVSGDTLTINEVRGKTPKACKHAATYRFMRTGNELHFTLVSDKCGERIKNVTAPWHKTKVTSISCLAVAGIDDAGRLNLRALVRRIADNS